MYGNAFRDGVGKGLLFFVFFVGLVVFGAKQLADYMGSSGHDHHSSSDFQRRDVDGPYYPGIARSPRQLDAWKAATECLDGDLERLMREALAQAESQGIDVEALLREQGVSLPPGFRLGFDPQSPGEPPAWSPAAFEPSASEEEPAAPGGEAGDDPSAGGRSWSFRTVEVSPQEYTRGDDRALDP